MHATCSNDIPPMAPHACDPETSPLVQLGSKVDNYLQEMLSNITPDMLEENGRLRLVVGNATLAGVVRGLLKARGHNHVDVVVATPATLAGKSGAWTPTMASSIKASLATQQPRHSGRLTKTQPSTKARKAARKQSKAGRKAAR